ncbi:hypothetical protein PoB_006928900 [Plakobranchus ocellatus]|uniref:Cysteine and tyrosine-rich protein 1 n=1 Tax=Plakobranchus ocellatus TaxID=259542 RepID=A0AAV4DF05_9GAST|nr:hypothetical protein PoB_006928900 [Plakobranchus ocellatus]
MAKVTTIAVSSLVRRPLSTCGVSLSRFWLHLLLMCWSTTTCSMAELCIYRRQIYNVFTNSYEKMLTTTSCPWGCCYSHSSPCCAAPIGLIVGCVLGGILLVAIVIVAVCCCCVCRRRARRGGTVRSSATRTTSSGSGVAGRGGRSRDAEVPQDGAVVFHSDASHTVDFPMPSMYEPPPSYDEVMRGETNAAFKPDSS